IPNFIFDYQTMQTFKPYGDRKEFPLINDDTWKLMNADVFYDCKTCVDRHRCGQTLTRDYYRKATDLIICSQDFYMMHIWTKEARTREGQLAFLPAASSVVFDEGHLLEVASQKALTYSLNEAMIQKPLLSVLTNDIRESLAQAIEEALQIAPTFFQQLFKESEVVKGSNRCKIIQSQNLMKKGKQLIYLLEKVDEELVFESEMHTIDSYVLNVVMEYLDAIEFSLKLFVEKEGTISWTLKNEQTCTLVVMPQMVNDVLQERVFSKKMPYVFSSATMSENGSFDYMASSLGITHYDSFTVDSPFDYEAQMKVAIPVVSNEQDVFNEIKKALEKTNHHALLLVNSKEELEKIKIFFKSENIHCLFEGDKEISQLIDEFEKDKAINLCSYSLWEGLDVPGDALQHVIICSLPFPPNDPVFQAKRKRATTPFIQVDIPYMHLRMRQGIGRLIRSERDSGWITILDSRLQDHQMYQQIIQLIPEKVTIQK
ncbi:MAG TPA: ATP-dependent DNA helicase, partial [Massilibacterium sp.]|nr:ATP-dependent DNA helicase [Massilibacterium sp.]